MAGAGEYLPLFLQTQFNTAQSVQSFAGHSKLATVNLNLKHFWAGARHKGLLQNNSKRLFSLVGGNIEC